MPEGRIYEVLVIPRRRDRAKLGLRELTFQIDTRDPWAREHYGTNAQEIGARLRAELPDSTTVVQNNDESDDVYRGGYQIDVGENAGGDDGPDDWPPTWFVHTTMVNGINRDLEEILIDLLPEGWSYDIDERLRFTFTCPHGHTIESSADCPDGCRNPLREWCTTQDRLAEDAKDER